MSFESLDHLECHIVSFEFDLVLNSFSGVSRKLAGCLIQGCLQRVSRLCQGSLNFVSRKI